MTSSLLAFTSLHAIILPRDADDWRPLPQGTYEHRSLPFGPIRSGITNGVIAFVYSPTKDKVFEVHLLNMDFKADPKPAVFKAPKEKKASSPTGIRRNKRIFTPFDPYDDSLYV